MDVKRVRRMPQSYQPRDVRGPCTRGAGKSPVAFDDRCDIDVERTRERLRNYRPTADELVEEFGAWQTGVN